MINGLINGCKTCLQWLILGLLIVFVLFAGKSEANTQIIPIMPEVQNPDTIPDSWPLTMKCFKNLDESTLEHQYGEILFLNMDGAIKLNDDLAIPTKVYLFANPKTTSWTIIHQVIDKYCVSAAGSKLYPGGTREEGMKVVE